MNDEEREILRNAQNLCMVEQQTSGNKGERRIHYYSDFQFEHVRLSTFYYFKQKIIIQTDHLARLGFYYDRKFDKVKCFFCTNPIPRKELSEPTNWKHLEGCSMKLYPLNGNVPFIDENLGNMNLFQKINKTLRSLYDLRITSWYPLKKNEFAFQTYFQEDLDFSFYENRLSTFKLWFLYLPENIRPKKEKFAHAGFIYSGYSDVVTCFKCKGSLFNVGIYDDPLKMHESLYGHCSLLGGQRRNIDEEITGMTEILRNEGLLLEHPMIANFILRGYDKAVVENWLLNYVVKTSCLPENLEICIEEIENEIKD